MTKTFLVKRWETDQNYNITTHSFSYYLANSLISLLNCL